MKNTNNILKYGIYGLTFLVPFIPFIVIDSLFFPFISGKGFAFRIIVELMVAFWAILALRNPKYRPKFSWVLVLATVFVFIIGIADVFGVNPLKSIWSNYERMEGWVTLVHLLGFLFVTTSVLKTEKLWHRFFNTSIVASVLMSFYGLFQLTGVFETHQGSRLDATLGNSAYLAVYMLIHIFLTLFLFLRSEKNSLIRWFYAGAIALQTVILYNTATRGAILGLIGGSIVTTLFIIFFEKENKFLKKISIGGLLGLVLIITLFIGLKNTPFVRDSDVLKRFADISFEEGTTKSRFMVWNMAFQGFKEKPILGWGQENFNYVFNKYYDPGMYKQEQWFDRTHNVFFDWLIAGGLLGLLSYLSLFGVITYYLFVDRRSVFSATDRGVILGLLTAYFIHNFFVFDHLVSYILFFSILGYIHTSNIDELDDSPAVPNERGNRIAIPIVIILAIFSIHFVNTKGLMTNVNLLKALIPYKEGVSKNLEYYDKALSYDSFGNQEVREQLAQFASGALGSKLDENSKQTIFDFTASEMTKQLEQDPDNARLEVIFGTTLANAGDYDNAIAHLQRALELSPNKQSIMLMLGNLYNAKGQRDEGSKYFKKAYELGPEFRDIKNAYVVSEISNGRSQTVEEYMSIKELYNEKIIQAYFGVGEYSKIIAIIDEHLKTHPNDKQAYLFLTATYDEMGYKTKAIEALHKVIEIDPTFKDQGEYYINQIKAGLKP